MLLIKCSSWAISVYPNHFSMSNLRSIKLMFRRSWICWTRFKLNSKTIWQSFAGFDYQLMNIEVETLHMMHPYSISRHVWNVEPNQISITVIFHIHHFFFRYENENSFIWTKSDMDHIVWLYFNRESFRSLLRFQFQFWV